ncbi:uncharacterized protein [Macrobrachium rosenbergii]|uniref:uncharacterized protein n=1 Tax=Macrobrachium rosenbergii TaxID=79674 RepID=UPI0034D533A2
MEISQSALASIRPEDWMISIDMKDAYFHVPVHQDSRKFLRFVFQRQSVPVQSLLLRSADSPTGIHACSCPNDEMITSDGSQCFVVSRQLAYSLPAEGKNVEDLHKTLLLTQDLGLLLNFQKSQLTPSQEIAYLGMRINSWSFRVFPAPKG